MGKSKSSSSFVGQGTELKIRRKLLQYAMRSLALAGLVFVVLIIIFPYFSRRVTGIVDWGMLDGFAGVISLSLFVGGFVFAVAEFRDAEKLKQLTIRAEIRKTIREMMEKFDTEEHVAARTWILINIPIKEADQDTHEWYEQTQAIMMKRKRGEKNKQPEGARAVKLTLNSFDDIGWHLQYSESIVGENEAVLELITWPIALVWKRLKPYVNYTRALRGDSSYYASADFIGSKCSELETRDRSSKLYNSDI